MTDKAELSSTERQLRDALARLVHQKPINRELKLLFLMLRKKRGYRMDRPGAIQKQKR